MMENKAKTILVPRILTNRLLLTCNFNRSKELPIGVHGSASAINLLVPQSVTKIIWIYAPDEQEDDASFTLAFEINSNREIHVSGYGFARLNELLVYGKLREDAQRECIESLKKWVYSEIRYAATNKYPTEDELKRFLT